MAKQLTKKAVQILEQQNHRQLWLLHVLDLYTNKPENLLDISKDRSIDWYIGALDSCQATVECILHLENAYKGYQVVSYTQGYEARSYHVQTKEPMPKGDRLHQLVNDESIKRRAKSEVF